MKKFLFISTFLVILFTFSSSSRLWPDPSRRSNGGSFETSVTYIVGDFSAFPQPSQSSESINSSVSIHAISAISSKGLSPISITPKSVGDVTVSENNGSVLYIGGKFREVGNKLAANSIVAYDTATDTWTSLCGGVSGKINSISIFRDEVFVAGSFKNAMNCDKTVVKTANIARFNITSQTWRPSVKRFSSFRHAEYNEMAVVPNWEGKAVVYAVGRRWAPDPNPGSFVSMWDESLGNWIDLDKPNSNNIYHTIVVNPITNDVYVGGRFYRFNGTVMQGIAVFRNSSQSWSPINNGMDEIREVKVIEFPKNSTDVMVGGIFSFDSYQNFAIWNGTKWIGSRASEMAKVCGNWEIGIVEDIDVLDDRYIYVSGKFSTVSRPLEEDSSITVNGVARFDLLNQTWSRVGDDSQFYPDAHIYSSTVTQVGNLYTIGTSQTSNGFIIYDQNLVFTKFDNAAQNWKPVFAKTSDGFLDSGRLNSVYVNGTDVFVGGSFSVIGDEHIDNVARWNGKAWMPLGVGLRNGTIHSIIVDGDEVYVGGYFNSTNIRGVPLVSVARFNINSGEWSPLGVGMDGHCHSNNTIYALEVSKDFIFVGGSFKSVSGVYSYNIAAWDRNNQKWLGIGKGGIVDYSGTGVVRDVYLNDTTLWIAGRFHFNNSVNAVQHLVAFNVTSWDWDYSVVGTSLTLGNQDGIIYSISVTDKNLIVAGQFDSSSDTTNLRSIGYWNKGVLSDIPSSNTLSPDEGVVEFYSTCYDPAKGMLYAAGSFNDFYAGSNVIQYNVSGQIWIPLSGTYTWSGAVRSIGLGLTRSSRRDIMPDDGVDPKVLIAIASITALAVILLGIISFLVLKYKKTRGQYIEIPNYTDEVRSLSSYGSESRIFSKQIYVKDLAVSSEGKINSNINVSDITFGDVISESESGELLRGIWKGKDVVIKRMMFKPTLVTPKFKEDFFKETNIMTGLDHINILKFLGASISPNGEVLMLTEYMENGSMKELFEKSGGKLDWKLKLRLATDASRGMDYLHSCRPPIIHRDLKSSCLLIDKRWRCKVSEFGIARIKPSNSATMSLVGTPSYMAPEVISHNRYSEKADVYSFGVFLCELYTQQPPYSDVNLYPEQIMQAVAHEGLRPTIPEDCSSALTVLIKDCLHADPQKRPPFSEVKQRLKRM